jgi:hypothetical protein
MVPSYADLADTGRALAPEECAELARAAAARVDTAALAREGSGSFELLWRNEHSEAWLNTWWEARDTGFHDHGGSCVGVFVIEGRAAGALVPRVWGTKPPLFRSQQEDARNQPERSWTSASFRPRRTPARPASRGWSAMSWRYRCCWLSFYSR